MIVSIITCVIVVLCVFLILGLCEEAWELVQAGEHNEAGVVISVLIICLAMLGLGISLGLS